MSVEVVWTHGENGGGTVDEGTSRTQCERCEIEWQATNRMYRECEMSVE